MQFIRHKITLALISLLAISMMGALTASTTVAQGLPVDILGSLGGLKSAYARKYVSTDKQLGFATPIAAIGTPAASSGVNVLTITVLEFETEAQAATAFQLASNPELAGMIAGESDATLEGKNVTDMGDQAKLYLGDLNRAGPLQAFGVLFVQDGNLGYIISGYGTDATIADTLDMIGAFASFMLDRDPGTEGVTMHQGVPATGSTFDLMPTNTDGDVIGDLVPMYDYDLLNQGESPMEEVATPAT